MLCAVFKESLVVSQVNPVG